MRFGLDLKLLFSKTKPYQIHQFSSAAARSIQPTPIKVSFVQRYAPPSTMLTNSSVESKKVHYPPLCSNWNFSLYTHISPLFVLVPANISFPKEEENILKFWDDIDAFQTSLKLSEGRPQYSFYDGKFKTYSPFCLWVIDLLKY